MGYAYIHILGRYERLEHTGGAVMVAVTDMDEAVRTAVRLKDEGIEAIELCGAFGPEGARRIIEATGGTVAVGYVVHFPEQDGLFEEVFGHRSRRRRQTGPRVADGHCSGAFPYANRYPYDSVIPATHRVSADPRLSSDVLGYASDG